MKQTVSHLSTELNQTTNIFTELYFNIGLQKGKKV